jgi:hypothetical protein
MNNKLIKYEDAVKSLKQLEIKQRIAKVASRHHAALGLSESSQSKAVAENKKEINNILTIVHLHKQLRKQYAKDNYQKDE